MVENCSGGFRQPDDPVLGHQQRSGFAAFRPQTWWWSGIQLFLKDKKTT
jgi:hypothetical protein